MAIRTLTFALLFCIVPAIYPQTAGQAQNFAIHGDHFVLNEKPFQIVSGEMHYTRIPRAYWRTRLKMAKAMGLNTVTTYVFWNEHEPKPGVFDFSGQNDVAEFIREAQQEGLYVVLRPGPYVCAEWEWGGYPAWLLKSRGIVVRSTDPKFMEPARRWLIRLGQELAPLQIGNGGPILMTQVENEYGSYGDDHGYMEQIHQALVDAGFTKSQLYTADGPEEVSNGSLPELPVGINFGGDSPKSAQDAFATLKKVRPNGPFFNSEFWAGWFDHWGGKHAHTSPQEQAANLDWMLRQGYSVSIYMFHGGTSFGWMNGANFDKQEYQPDVTSYDYDSALDESGRPTKKYFMFRNVISKDTGIAPPPVPPVTSPMTVDEFSLHAAASLWDNLPAPIHSEQILSMEDIGQAYGYILYRTRIPESKGGDLILDQLHSYAVVYLDAKQVGTIDRRLKQDRVTLPPSAPGARLDILVENTGRVNFGHQITDERAGITKQVTMAGTSLRNWEIYPLPLTNMESFHFSNLPCHGPCLYRGSFQLSHTADTFLDTTSFKKGELWLNGHPLGRIWNIGPQKTLYAPAPWLKQGHNEIIVLDLFGSPNPVVGGLSHPVLDGTAQ